MTYLAAGAAGLLIIEISDPTSPSLVGMVEAVAMDVEISEDWAFVATGDHELLAVDIRDPENAPWTKLLNFQTRPWRAGSLVISGDFAYIFSGSFNSVIDVSNPTSQQVSPRQVGFWWGHSDLFDDSPGNITRRRELP